MSRTRWFFFLVFLACLRSFWLRPSGVEAGCRLRVLAVGTFTVKGSVDQDWIRRVLSPFFHSHYLNLGLELFEMSCCSLDLG